MVFVIDGKLEELIKEKTLLSEQEEEEMWFEFLPEYVKLRTNGFTDIESKSFIFSLIKNNEQLKIIEYRAGNTTKYSVLFKNGIRTITPSDIDEVKSLQQHLYNNMSFRVDNYFNKNIEETIKNLPKIEKLNILKQKIKQINNYSSKLGELYTKMKKSKTFKILDEVIKKRIKDGLEQMKEINLHTYQEYIAKIEEEKEALTNIYTKLLKGDIV